MYDIAIIGAGIQGAGVAQAASAAGYNVIVLEKDAVGAGTSQKSSKLIHGGLRYLETFEFNLVRECLKERKLLLRLAPELISLEKFYIPLYKTSKRSPATLAAGLSLYWLLSGCQQPFTTISRKNWESFDGLNTQKLSHIFQYFDAQTDDLALTQSVMKSAQELGAELYCPAKVCDIQINHEYGEVIFEDNAVQHTIRCRFIVNCTGPWAGSLIDKLGIGSSSPPMELIQGSHLLLPKLLNHHFYLESPKDKRAIFALPWKGKLLLGTTETPFNNNPDNVVCLDQEQEYLLETLTYYFPNLSIDKDTITQMAGLRVLPKGEDRLFSRSREVIFHFNSPRLLSVMGGKLTTYRLTAQKTIREIERFLPRKNIIANTAHLKLSPV